MKDRTAMPIHTTPQPKWLPLRRAVFRFAASLEHKHPQTKLPSRAPFSLDEITEILRRRFDRAVIAGTVILYARPEKITAGFVQIPGDVWSLLKVTDWKNAVAVAPDGTRYWSLHAVAASAVSEMPSRAAADSAHTAPSKARRTRGAPPKYDFDAIRAEAFRLFRAHGLPDREGDDGWQTRADLERCLAEFCMGIHGKEPAESTLQGFADRAIRDWKMKTDNTGKSLSVNAGDCRPTRSSGRST
jgi:hypothetical protein